MEQICISSDPGRGVAARDGPGKPPAKTECPRPAGSEASNGGATGEREVPGSIGECRGSRPARAGSGPRRCAAGGTRPRPDPSGNAPRREARAGRGSSCSTTGSRSACRRARWPSTRDCGSSARAIAYPSVPPSPSVIPRIMRAISRAMRRDIEPLAAAPETLTICTCTTPLPLTTPYPARSGFSGMLRTAIVSLPVQLDDLGDDMAVTPASERGPLPLVIPAAHGIRRVVVEDVAAGEILAAGLIETNDHVTEALTHRHPPPWPGEPCSPLRAVPLTRRSPRRQRRERGLRLGCRIPGTASSGPRSA